MASDKIKEIQDSVTDKVVDKVADKVADAIIEKFKEIGEFQCEGMDIHLTFNSMKISIDTDREHKI